MKGLMILSLVFFGLTAGSYAQSTVEPTQQQIKEQDGHKFFMTEPVEKILKLEYSDGTPIDAVLSKDRKEVLMKNYTHKGRVVMTYIDHEGRQAEISKTPCDIIADVLYL